MAGDGALLTHEDAVEVTWAADLLTRRGSGLRSQPGMGLAAADALIAPDGDWHNLMLGEETA